MSRNDRCRRCLREISEQDHLAGCWVEYLRKIGMSERHCIEVKNKNKYETLDSWQQRADIFGDYATEREIRLCIFFFKRKTKEELEPPKVYLKGEFCGEHENILRKVSEEIRLSKRNPAVDDILSDERFPAQFTSLYKARDMAYFRYSLIEQYADRDYFWNDVVRFKLRLSDSEISNFKTNYDGDEREAKYQCLLRYMARENPNKCNVVSLRPRGWGPA